MPRYQRILLKLSGEALASPEGYGIDYEACSSISLSIKELREKNLQLAIVIGGGNIFRGLQAAQLSLPRTPADQMGMLATLINGIALKEALERIGCHARVLSALDCPRVVESYSWQTATEALAHGEIVIFVGGTGNPYFTTDTAAAMRASEISADLLFKATKVDGVYDSDPHSNPEAQRYPTLSFSQALQEELRVMDATALALCRDNAIPILVGSLFSSRSLYEIIDNPALGTLVT